MLELLLTGSVLLRQGLLGLLGKLLGLSLQAVQHVLLLLLLLWVSSCCSSVATCTALCTTPTQPLAKLAYITQQNLMMKTYATRRCRLIQTGELRS